MKYPKSLNHNHEWVSNMPMKPKTSLKNPNVGGTPKFSQNNKDHVKVSNHLLPNKPFIQKKSRVWLLWYNSPIKKKVPPETQPCPIIMIIEEYLVIELTNMRLNDKKHIWLTLE